MFTDEEILEMAKKLNINFNYYSFNDLKTGIKIELEHGLINPLTNVTDNNLEKTMKIALAHLNEFPNYYNNDYGLPAFEEVLKKKLKENT